MDDTEVLRKADSRCASPYRRVRQGLPVLQLSNRAARSPGQSERGIPASESSAADMAEPRATEPSSVEGRQVEPSQISAHRPRTRPPLGCVRLHRLTLA